MASQSTAIRLRKVLAYVSAGFLLMALGIYLGGRSISRYKAYQDMSLVEEIAKDIVLMPSNVRTILNDFSIIKNPSRPAEKPIQEGAKVIPNARLPLGYDLAYSYYNVQDQAFYLARYDLDKGSFTEKIKLPFRKVSNIYDQWVQSHQSRYCLKLVSWRLSIGKVGLRQPLFFDSLVVVGSGVERNLLAVDKNGNIAWISEHFSHHSLEKSPDGRSFWFCSSDTCRQGESAPYHLDQIVQMNLEGEELFSRRLDELFIANPRHDYSNLNVEMADKYHLNDVQPVPGDSEYWKKGDVFLSIRNMNLIVLYRPSNDSILWSKNTGWYYQHDVSFIDDSTIAIFDNQNHEGYHAYDEAHPSNRSRIIYYHFDEDSTSVEFEDVIEKHQVFTPTQGRFELKPDSIYYIEESDKARMIMGDLKTGESYAVQVQGNSEGKANYFGWSRLAD